MNRTRDMSDPWDTGLIFMLGWIAGLASGGLVAIMTLVLT